MKIKKIVYNLIYGKRDGKLGVIYKTLYRQLEYKNIILVDIGAHKGEFIEEISTYRNIEQAFIAEAIPENYNYIIDNYSTKQFYTENCAISDKNGVIEFNINEFSETSSLLEFKTIEETDNINKKKSELIKIKSVTLDNFYKSNKIKNIDLMKIDVQGAEALVIDGGKKALANTHFLIIELSIIKIYEGSESIEPINNRLRNIGFVLIELQPVYRAENDDILQFDGLYRNTKFD